MRKVLITAAVIFALVMFCNFKMDTNWSLVILVPMALGGGLILAFILEMVKPPDWWGK